MNTAAQISYFLWRKFPKLSHLFANFHYLSDEIEIPTLKSKQGMQLATLGATTGGSESSRKSDPNNFGQTKVNVLPLIFIGDLLEEN